MARRQVARIPPGAAAPKALFLARYTGIEIRVLEAVRPEDNDGAATCRGSVLSSTGSSSGGAGPRSFVAGAAAP